MTTKTLCNADAFSGTKRHPQAEIHEKVKKTASGRVRKPATRRSMRLELRRMTITEAAQKLGKRQGKASMKHSITSGKKTKSTKDQKSESKGHQLTRETQPQSPTVYPLETVDEEKGDIGNVEYPIPLTAQQKEERRLARMQQLRIMRARETAESREVRLLQRRGLYVRKPPVTERHIMWANQDKLVKIHRYSPTIT